MLKQKHFSFGFLLNGLKLISLEHNTFPLEFINKFDDKVNIYRNTRVMFEKYIYMYLKIEVC